MNEKEINVLMNRKLLQYLKYLNLNFYMHCVFGKHSRQKFKTSSHISKGILEYIRSDLWGPSSTIYLGGSSYFVTCIDDYPNNVWLYTLKIKSIMFNVFKQFRILVEKRTANSM